MAAGEEQAEKGWTPRIVVFACNWCAALAAELAGSNGLTLGASVRVVQVPCSGRVNPLYVLKALQRGADGVYIFGCHPGDCHYGDGNLHARRKFAVLKRFLVALGMEPQRIRVSWVTASEGKHFVTLVQRAVRDLRTLGPNDKLLKGSALAGSPMRAAGG